MVNLLEASAGRIVLRDTTGDIVFDTNERLFTATDARSGSVSLSGYTATNTYAGGDTLTNVENMILLSAITAGADTVRGAFSVSTAGGGTVSNLGWFNASGTYVHYFGAAGPVLGGGNNAQITQFGCYTFIASGGGLYLHERVYLKATTTLSPSTSYSVTMLPLTISYNLLCGTFV